LCCTNRRRGEKWLEQVAGGGGRNCGQKRAAKKAAVRGTTKAKKEREDLEIDVLRAIRDPSLSTKKERGE